MRANQNHQWSYATVQDMKQHRQFSSSPCCPLCKQGKACSPAQAFRTGFLVFDHARHRDNSSGCHMPATATSAGSFLSTLGFKMLKLSVTAQQLQLTGHCLLSHSVRSEHAKQHWPASTIMPPWCGSNHGLGRAGQRGHLSETTMCKCSQCSKVWADLPDPGSFAAQRACLSSSCPGGFCYQKVTLSSE